MASIEATDITANSYYLPHQPVFKESTTSPIRIVFNASSPTSNSISLNDCLMTGPKLQVDLSSIILRWRTHKLVYAANIAKMFRSLCITKILIFNAFFGDPISNKTLNIINNGHLWHGASSLSRDAGSTATLQRRRG